MNILVIMDMVENSEIAPCLNILRALRRKYQCEIEIYLTQENESDLSVFEGFSVTEYYHSNDNVKSPEYYVSFEKSMKLSHVWAGKNPSDFILTLGSPYSCLQAKMAVGLNGKQTIIHWITEGYIKDDKAIRSIQYSDVVWVTSSGLKKQLEHLLTANRISVVELPMGCDEHVSMNKAIENMQNSLVDYFSKERWIPNDY